MKLAFSPLSWCDVSDFFPNITGTDKRYHSQCQKLLLFPIKRLKFTNSLAKKIDHWHQLLFFSLKHCMSYFPVLNRKYRSLQCTWSLAYDYSWYLITANITRERLMHLVLVLLFLLYLSIWHYMYTDKKSQFIWFWRHFSQLNGYRYQYQWVEKNCCPSTPTPPLCW